MIDISEKLIENITKKYILFFPSSVYSEIEDSMIAGMIPKESYDIIAYNRDKLGATTHDIEKIALVDILNKNKILQNNLLLLLDTKTKVNAEVFQFIIDDYKKHMDCHLVITSWMVDNIKITFPDLSNTIFNAFKNQNLFFRNHYSQLEQYFKLSPQAPKLDSVDVLKNIKMTFSNTPLKNEVLEESKNSKPKISTPTKKIKPQFSDEEIDNFLMKTVFGVDLS
ncbi:hypothetical protein [Winogradskyella sp. PC D3.3]